MRSLLFVPADDEKKLAKALGVGADALILDLEDSVAPQRKEPARWMAADFLAEHRAREDRPRLYVRINSLETAHWEEDLAAVMDAGPDGLVIPKARGGDDVHQLSLALDLAEARADRPHGATRLIVLATEVPEAILSLETFVGASPRLAALTWGAEDLSVALGASEVRQSDGRWTSPYRLVRDLCLLTAAAARVPAIDTVHTDFRDLEGLEREAREAARDGFSGKLAIHPSQVPAINVAFTPGAEEIARAREVVALFENAGSDNEGGEGARGVVAHEGVMLDAPHLARAERVLERARLAGVLED